MNTAQCIHPHEHQRVSINNQLKEISHECQLCWAVVVGTLGVVGGSQLPQSTDLWKVVQDDKDIH